MELLSTKRKNKYRFILYAYIIVMLLSYLAYLLLDNYRLNKSAQWFAATFITSDDVKSISQLGQWVSGFELIFLFLFIVMGIICLKVNIKILKQFILANSLLFLGIALLSYGFFLMSALPIGNALQPLLLSTFILGCFSLYLFWQLKIKGKKANE